MREVIGWCPGTEEPTETFDIAGLLTPELQSQIPADWVPLAGDPGRPRVPRGDPMVGVHVLTGPVGAVPSGWVVSLSVVPPA